MKSRLAYAFASLFLLWLAVMPAKAVEISLGHKGSAWKVYSRYTDKGKNFMLGDVRRYRKDGSFKVLFEGKGKVSKKQLAIFSRLWPTDRLVIPDRLITAREFQAKNQTIAEICAGFNNPKGCASTLAKKNGVAKKARLLANVKLNGTVLVPKSYVATFQGEKRQQPGEKNTNTRANLKPKKDFSKYFGVLRNTYVDVPIAAIAILCFIIWRPNKSKVKAYLNKAAWSPFWNNFATGDFLPRPLYSSELYYALYSQSHNLRDKFNAFRQQKLFSGDQSLYLVDIYVNKVLPRATVYIRNNNKLELLDRPYYKFLQYVKTDIEECYRRAGPRPGIDYRTDIRGETVIVRIFAAKAQKAEKREGLDIRNAG